MKKVYRLIDPLRPYVDLFQAAVWIAVGKPMPPPPYMKHKLLRKCAREFNLDILVETGTYLGDTVYAMRRVCRNIFSIELSKELAGKARQRFSRNAGIQILEGDSVVILPQILRSIDTPCLFWLDAHFSEGVTVAGSSPMPILEEVKAIIEHPVKGHVILVDDARAFVGKGGYPTLDQLNSFVTGSRPDIIMDVRNDVILLRPGKPIATMSGHQA
jgi:SAM-dependent methyltransferase